MELQISRSSLKMFFLPCDCDGAADVSWSIVTSASLTSHGPGAERADGSLSETSASVGSGGAAAEESDGTDSGSDTITVCWAFISSGEHDKSMVDCEKRRNAIREENKGS